MSSSAKDTPDLTKTQSNSGAKRPREESDIARGKLIDQKFDMSKYADPLAPRQGSASHFLPQGVTEEMERKWLATIAASRNQSG